MCDTKFHTDSKNYNKAVTFCIITKQTINVSKIVIKTRTTERTFTRSKVRTLIFRHKETHRYTPPSDSTVKFGAGRGGAVMETRDSLPYDSMAMYF